MKKTIFFIITFFAVIISAQETEQQNFGQGKSLLLQPITVTVGGDFIVTGSFPASKLQRLDYFITTVFVQASQDLRGGVNNLESMQIIRNEINRYALRGITLKHSNGEVLNIDLLKFRLTGDFKYNPYLMNDDVIIFPSYNVERDIVDISGAVNKPCKFQFVDGDKLSDAILFAGGINKSFDNVDEVEIYRSKENGNSEEVIKTHIGDNVSLKRGDRISVLYTENNKKVFKVLVLGEVNRPGHVYISKNSTSIKEVILKAGGFTAKADLKRSEILKGTDEAQLLKMRAIREQYKSDTTFTTIPMLGGAIQQFKTETLKMGRTSNLTKDETEYSFDLDNWLRVYDSRGVIDFEKIFSDSSTDGKYIIDEEDIVIVPAKQNLVYVFGQVVNPGYFQFVENKDWKYYIEKSGGLTSRAKDESDIRIIKGTSKSWVEVDKNTRVGPGDFIYVPKNLPMSFGDIIQQIGSISSIVATAVTLVYIIIQSTKN
jgi:protein involved in polysaccharide export with SLBB domain